MFGGKVKKLKEKCTYCIQNAPSQPAPPPNEIRTPSYPFQMMVCDYMELKGEHYVVMADRYSGWPVVVKTPKFDSDELIGIFRTWFAQYGVPEFLTTDGGKQFTAEKIRNFLRSWGVKHEVTSAHTPHSNLRAECTVKSIKRMLANNVGVRGTLNTDRVVQALLQYRNTPLHDINLSSAQILYARELRDKVPGHRHRYFLRQEWVLLEHEREKTYKKRLAASKEQWARGP